MTPQLGALLALTGPEAPYARQLEHAIALALDDAPVRLAVHVEDDHASPDRAHDAAARLADDPSVLAVVGPMNSWTCEPAGAVFAAAGLPHITPSASNVALAGRGWPTFFRACPNDHAQASALAEVAARLTGARSVAAVDDGSSFAAPLGDRFLAECGARGLGPLGRHAVVHEEAATPAALAELGATLAALAPDAVLIAGLEDACRASARALREHGVRAIFLGTDGIKPTRALWVEGFPAVWLTNSGTDAAHRAPVFHARMVARAGAHDSVYTVETYDATARLAAILAAGARTRAEVLAALRAPVPAPGLATALAFDGRGERLAAEIGLYRDDGDGPRFLGPVAELVG